MGRESVSMTVRVDDEEWQRVPSFEGAGPNDSVYVLDADDGTVRFGDGQRGRRPPSASAVAISFGTGIKRPTYFAGKVLSVDDFNDEQRYLNEKRRLHNRALHGSGVANGLEVTVMTDSEPTSIVVSPGFALDAEGREIELCDRVIVEITSGESPVYVRAEYGERETDWSPLADGSQGETVPTRVEEFARIRVSSDQMSGEGITLARLVKTATGWVVDQSFTRPRCR
jgi:hypothetical protein